MDYSKLFQLKSLYFNAAYLGPMPLKSRQAIQAFTDQALDPTLLSEAFELDDQARDRFARLLGTPSQNIAISTSVSELVSHVANGLTLGEGDEVLLLQGDYPSMVLPWMVQAELKGFQIRFLDLEDLLEPARFAKQLTSHTRLAGCSHVMFNTGTKLPIAELGKAAQEKEILFLADTSQSFGGMPLSKEILTNVDILVGVGYKWLLGPYGSAYGFFSPRAQEKVQRTHASWLNMPGAKARERLLNYTTECQPGARKFDCGEVSSHLICTGLIASLDLLSELGLEKIERHNAELVTHFLRHAPSSVQIVGHPEFRSNIVCLKHPDIAALKARLKAKGVEVSLREGTLRISFHLFNTLEQTDLLLKALRS